MSTSSTTLTPSNFAALLSKYPSTHHHRHTNTPNASCDCTFRFTTAPSLIASRRHHRSNPSTSKPPKATDLSSSKTQADDSHGHGHLTLADLVRLVHWKINHGSYFPSLPKLAASNDAALVERITGEAFALLATIPAPPPTTTTTTTTSADDTAVDERIRGVIKALTTLTRLRGVGPATASLLLCVADAGATDTVPFFADELFAWARRGFRNLDPLPSTKSKTKDKDRHARLQIKYSVKEYEELLRATWAFLGRLRAMGVGVGMGDGRAEGEPKVVTAGDVEMVARVLGVLGNEGGEEAEKAERGGEVAAEKLAEQKEQKKRKRAASTSEHGVNEPSSARAATRKAALSDETEDASSTQRRVMPRRAARRG